MQLVVLLNLPLLLLPLLLDESRALRRARSLCLLLLLLCLLLLCLLLLLYLLLL